MDIIKEMQMLAGIIPNDKAKLNEDFGGRMLGMASGAALGGPIGASVGGEIGDEITDESHESDEVEYEEDTGDLGMATEGMDEEDMLAGDDGKTTITITVDPSVTADMGDTVQDDEVCLDPPCGDDEYGQEIDSYEPNYDDVEDSELMAMDGDDIFAGTMFDETPIKLGEDDDLELMGDDEVKGPVDDGDLGKDLKLSADDFKTVGRKEVDDFGDEFEKDDEVADLGFDDFDLDDGEEIPDEKPAGKKYRQVIPRDEMIEDILMIQREGLAPDPELRYSRSKLNMMDEDELQTILDVMSGRESGSDYDDEEFDESYDVDEVHGDIKNLAAPQPRKGSPFRVGNNPEIQRESTEIDDILALAGVAPLPKQKVVERKVEEVAKKQKVSEDKDSLDAIHAQLNEAFEQFCSEYIEKGLSNCGIKEAKFAAIKPDPAKVKVKKSKNAPITIGSDEDTDIAEGKRKIDRSVDVDTLGDDDYEDNLINAIDQHRESSKLRSKIQGGGKYAGDRGWSDSMQSGRDERGNYVDTGYSHPEGQSDIDYYGGTIKRKHEVGSLGKKAKLAMESDVEESAHPAMAKADKIDQRRQAARAEYEKKKKLKEPSPQFKPTK